MITLDELKEIEYIEHLTGYGEKNI